MYNYFVIVFLGKVINVDTMSFFMHISVICIMVNSLTRGRLIHCIHYTHMDCLFRD